MAKSYSCVLCRKSHHKECNRIKLTNKAVYFMHRKLYAINIDCTITDRRSRPYLQNSCKVESYKRTRLTVVPVEASTQAFINKSILIPSATRCCSSHLMGKYFRVEAMNKLVTVSTGTAFNRTDLVDLLHRTRQMIKSSGKLNFEMSCLLYDEAMINLTGLTIDQLESVCKSVASKIRSSENRTYPIHI